MSKRRWSIGDYEEIVWLDHDGVERETEKAKLFDLGDQKKWIPKSQIIDEGEDLVGVKRWWAEKEELDI